MKIQLFNETKYEIAQNVLQKICTAISLTENEKLQEISESAINLIMQSPAEITLLNNELFHKNHPTDVISVNLGNKDVFGEIYICPKEIEKNARKFGVSHEQELVRIIIHGILHLAGYDHRQKFGESDEEMFEIQEWLVEKVFSE